MAVVISVAKTLPPLALQDDWLMPAEVGVGFVDVGIGHPGTELASFSTPELQSWVPEFYRRLTSHMQRACSSVRCVGHHLQFLLEPPALHNRHVDRKAFCNRPGQAHVCS